MKILGFETCNNSSTIALIEDGKIIDQIENNKKQSQSESLVLEIEEILKRNNIWYDNLSAVATCKGPASFTGTRISLTCARTIALAAKIPVILPNSCEIIAHKYQKEIPTLVVMQGSLVDYFFQFYSSREALTTELKLFSDNFLQELILNKFDEIFVCGSGQNFFENKLVELGKKIDFAKFTFSGASDEVKAQDICQLAYHLIQKNNFNQKDLSAIYLNEPRITERKK